MHIPIILSGMVLLISISIYYASSIYPERRVMTGIELLTDGFAPDILAESGRAMLAHLWRNIFGGGYMESSGLVGAIVDDIRSKDDKTGVNILEMAAGSGVPAGLWNQALQQQGIAARTIITDLQPTPKAWDQVVQEFSKNSSVTYVKEPVDATDASAAVAKYVDNDSNNNTNQTFEIRMIHFALHHIPPKYVQAMFQDAVNSKSAILVADLVPSMENVLLNSPLGLMEFAKATPGELVKHPELAILLPLMMPFIPIIALNDPTVSVLRSYSHGELQDMLDQCTKGDDVKYQVQSFQFFSFAEYIGIPPVFGFLKKPHLQVFYATPVTAGNPEQEQ